MMATDKMDFGHPHLHKYLSVYLIWLCVFGIFHYFLSVKDENHLSPLLFCLPKYTYVMYVVFMVYIVLFG